MVVCPSLKSFFSFNIPLMKPCLLTGPRSFACEFERCCSEYHSISFATAWCGDPARLLPFRLLDKLKGKITATIGVSFNETHPDAIQWLISARADLRIYRPESGIFHPKVYLFQNGLRYALFVGSSNFTHAGFYTNTEFNVLMEGEDSGMSGTDVANLITCLAKWHSSECSFAPDGGWLERYRVAYLETRDAAKRNQIPAPPDSDEIAPGNWLATAEWPEFYAEVTSRLSQEGRTVSGYHDVLDAAATKLPLPWTLDHFADLERRRVIGGIGEYGWLGHVAASGRFRSLAANGPASRQRVVIEAINEVAALSSPIDEKRLMRALTKLEQLGFSMKTWGRMLAITRPDLYCTISAPSVQETLSKTLGIPRSGFERGDGYIQLLKLIHGSPWFCSQRPTDPAEAAVWERRVAFIDPIYYRGRNPT
jgi:HKD family nuclease